MKKKRAFWKGHKKAREPEDPQANNHMRKRAVGGGIESASWRTVGCNTRIYYNPLADPEIL
jgi:hypothetical protein